MVHMADRSHANISLSQDLQSLIEDNVAQSGYETASDYLRDLVRSDLKQRLRDQIDGELEKSVSEPLAFSQLPDFLPSDQTRNSCDCRLSRSEEPSAAAERDRP